MSISEPAKIPRPFAETGLKNPIPPAANNTTGKAGFDKGFPERTMLTKASGGIPPSGMDFNGILYDITSAIRYMQSGGKPTYDAAFAAAIGGYPSGAVLIGDDGVSVFQNAVDGNATDPNSGGAGWTRPDLQVMELYRRSYADAGYNVVGTFRGGFTLVNANDIGVDEATGKGYTGPAGLVAAGTDPESGGFVDRSGDLFSWDRLPIEATLDWGVKTSPGADGISLLSYIPKSQWAAIKNRTSVYDASAALTQAVADATTSGRPLYLPAGKVRYSSLPNNKTSNLKMWGPGSALCELEYTGSGDAMAFNAFISGGASDPYVERLFIGGFKITGTAYTRGIYAQGVARSHWNDIKVNGSTQAANSVAFQFSGCQLNKFESLVTSYSNGPVPYKGIFITAGTRGGVSVGASTNNIFYSTYPEGNVIGIQLATNGSDQNIFIGGAPEACTEYGLVVGTNCRYNTFIGIGAENLNATSADISDSGIYNKYINCYSSSRFTVVGSAKGIKIDGGYFERIEIQSGAKGTSVSDVTVNNWNTGNGGFFNQGTGTRWSNIFDSDLGDYVHVTKPRSVIPVTASPTEYTNIEGIPVKVRVYSGTVTAVQVSRGGDIWVEPNPTAAGVGAGNAGMYLLMPGDKLIVSYSVAPTLNAIPMSGF